MRSDMAKVVTERPRRGSGYNNHARNTVTSTRGKVRDWEDEVDEDLWAPQHSAAKHGRQFRDYDDSRYGMKSFSDLIGPLRGYLRKQVGRPWDKVYSELSQYLDKRSTAGSHIWDHVKWEVELDCHIGRDGKVYRHARRWLSAMPLQNCLYVHPVTRLLCKAPTVQTWRWSGKEREFRLRLREFGPDPYPVTVRELMAYRIEGALRLWERRPVGWFIHQFEHVPEQTFTEPHPWRKGATRTIIQPAHLRRVWTKQASRREVHAARELLGRQPF